MRAICSGHFVIGHFVCDVKRRSAPANTAILECRGLKEVHTSCVRTDTRSKHGEKTTTKTDAPTNLASVVPACTQLQVAGCRARVRLLLSMGMLHPGCYQHALICLTRVMRVSRHLLHRDGLLRTGRVLLLIHHCLLRRAGLVPHCC